MIYEKHNFNESFSNATGNSRNRMSIFELGKTIKKHPKEVISAIKDANVNIDENANTREIIKTILMNKRNTRMIQNISAIIFASSSFDGNYSNLDEGVNPVVAGEKGKFMEQIGAFFKGGKERREKRKADATASGNPTFFQKVGGFFKKNKEGITTIGTSLYDGLQTKKGQGDLTNQGSGDGGSGDGGGGGKEIEKSFFEKNKMYIIGAVVIIGGYFAYKKFYAKGK
jgi:hypothetical protein